jgi:hypothetical protein
MAMIFAAAREEKERKGRRKEKRNVWRRIIRRR